MRRVFLKRLALSLLCFGAAFSYLNRTHSWSFVDWIIDAGKAAGCQTMEISVTVIGPNGPFYGDDLHTAAWNWTYRNIPFLTVLLLAYTAAAAAYWLAAGPLARTRLFGYRGPTRCGRCAYALKGLREPRCPECGQAV